MKEAVSSGKDVFDEKAIVNDLTIRQVFRE
jgi:hypothetical protein